jgi:mRNA-degrading endonuclease RelE of RelBE toxin-antitoxin system
MKFEIIVTPRFAKSFKALAKRYHSIKTDLEKFKESILENPFQGDELIPGTRKIRIAIASKGKGKSGGARIITYTFIADEVSGTIYLIDIFDKSEYSTVDNNKIKAIISELGL